MAKSISPFHSIAASGVLAGVVAAVTKKTGPHILRRPPRTVPPPSERQLSIRNAWRWILAALHFATINTNAPRPYSTGYRAAWRALQDESNTWANYAQAAFAALVYDGTAPDFPAWSALTANQQAAWNLAATIAEPPLPLIQQTAPDGTPATPIQPGRALFLHEFAAPWQYITNPPDADYPPLYRATPGNYTRALWDAGPLAWDGDAYSWDNFTGSTWADVPAPGWDTGLTFWDAR